LKNPDATFFIIPPSVAIYYRLLSLVKFRIL